MVLRVTMVSAALLLWLAAPTISLAHPLGNFTVNHYNRIELLPGQLHVHNGPFEVVARDGEPLKTSARFLADTVNVGPVQRYAVVWTALEPGQWLIHCHIPHHTTNNNVEEAGGGGLMMLINVVP